MKKIITIALKAIDYASFALLTFFAGVFALLSVAALVCTFAEGEAFNLIGTAVAGVLAWITWSIRRDVL